jgi:hypothetical protein
VTELLPGRGVTQRYLAVGDLVVGREEQVRSGGIADIPVASTRCLDG